MTGDQMPGKHRPEHAGSARDQHRAFGIEWRSALESLDARQPRGDTHAVTERELRLVAAVRFGDRNVGAGPVVDVDHRDTPRMLGLCASQQTPHGRLGEIGDNLR
jgi:hypothetical protein